MTVLLSSPAAPNSPAGTVRRILRALGLLGAAAVTVALAAPMGSAEAASSISGTIQLVSGDSAHGDVERVFVTTTGGLFELSGAHRNTYRTGQAVTVAGRITGHDIDVSTVSARSTGTTAGAAAMTSASPAAMNVLVELVTWTTPDSMTRATAQQLYGSTDSAWFGNESYGATSMTATATNWLTIAAPTEPGGTYTSCDNIGAIQTAGDAAATTAGYTVGDYTNVVYYYPTCPGERFGGWGEQPGDRTFLIGELDARVSIHELGHNLGLGHSHSDTCRDTAGTVVAYAAPCSVNEYGDPTSAMAGGFSGQGMYTASQQAFLGWLGTPAHAVASVTSSGTFALAPLESASGGTQALRVTDSSGRQFWIEYRQPTGNDGFLASGETNGVLIRTGDDTTDLYDMTPATPGTFTDAALPAGRSWTTPLSNVTVSVTSISSTGARVTVGFAAASYPLSVTTSGVGTGTVAGSPGSISCGVTCSDSVATGTSVTLTAAAAASSTFAGWGGACAGTALTCTVPMTAARSVTATFTTAAVTRVVEETAAAISYTGTWTSTACATRACSRNGSENVTTIVGSSASLSFTGSSVAWIASKGPTAGKASVYVDGVLTASVNLSALTARDGVAVFTSSALVAGPHTLRVQVTTAKQISVDSFRVTG